jgi:hypothetical protein
MADIAAAVGSFALFVLFAMSVPPRVTGTVTDAAVRMTISGHVTRTTGAPSDRVEKAQMGGTTGRLGDILPAVTAEKNALIKVFSVIVNVLVTIVTMTAHSLGRVPSQNRR